LVIYKNNTEMHDQQNIEIMKEMCVVINECSSREQNNVMVNSEELIGTTMSDAIDGVWYKPLLL
jgi:hypothetical protein